jgi:hypothetical protein
MDTVITKFKIKEPRFAKQYEHLFARYSRKWGGSEQDRLDKVKVFAKNYELYIYAFFLGLKNERPIPLSSSEKSDSNVMRIEDWKPKELRDYLVACTLVQDGTPFRDYDFMTEEEINRKSTELKEIVEAYTNGGLSILQEEFEEDKKALDEPFAFTELVFE